MLKSIATLGAAIGVKAFASIAIFLMAAARWDAELFGSFMYAFAVASVLVVVCEYGFTNQVLKDAQNLGSPFLTGLFKAKIQLGAITAVIAHFLHFQFTPIQNSYFLPLFYSLLCASFFDFISTALKSLDKTKADFHLSVWTSIVYIATSFAVLELHSSAVALSWGFLVARAVGLIAAIYIFQKHAGINIFTSPSHETPRKAIRAGFPFAADTAINAILNVADGILLSHFAGNATNGIYQTAARLNQSIPLIFSVLASFFLPKLSSNRLIPHFKSNVKKFLLATTIASAALVLLFLGASYVYTHATQSGTLQSAAPLLFGLAGLATIRLFCGWMSAILIARNMQTHKTVGYGIGLVVIAATSIYSIPTFKAWGVIISYASGFLACALIMAPATYKAFNRDY